MQTKIFHNGNHLSMKHALCTQWFGLIETARAWSPVSRQASLIIWLQCFTSQISEFCPAKSLVASYLREKVSNITVNFTLHGMEELMLCSTLNWSPFEWLIINLLIVQMLWNAYLWEGDYFIYLWDFHCNLFKMIINHLNAYAQFRL